MKVVIFGGTTEGRQLAEYLIQLNKKQKMQTIEVHVCVASEYGAQVPVSYTHLTLPTTRI